MLVLTSAKPEAGEQPDTDLRELQFRKNQYGRVGELIVLRYQRGLFLPERGLSSLDKAAREAEVESILVSAAKKLEARGQDLSPAQTSHNYAPTIIAKQPEAKGVKKAELVAALGRLLDSGRLQLGTLRAGTTREKTVIRFGFGVREDA